MDVKVFEVDLEKFLLFYILFRYDVEEESPLQPSLFSAKLYSIYNSVPQNVVYSSTKKFGFSNWLFKSFDIHLS